MTKTFLKRVWPSLLLAAAAPGTNVAQTSPHPAPTGTVTGRIYCSDTNEPARFAKVYLEPVPPETKLGSMDATQVNGETAKPAAGAQRSDTVMTTLDGSFTLGNIAPGAYYVVVQEAGYINAMELFTASQLKSPSQEIRDTLAQKLTRVVVEADQAETVAVRIDRGGTITGTVLYDDGSPAVGIFVNLLHKDRSGAWVYPDFLSQGIQTDDRGRYRFASLVADEYMVRATLELTRTQFAGASTLESFGSSLSFFGAGTPRLDSVSSTHLINGQERNGQDMTIPISKLRQLAGRVLAGADSHPVNAATISILYADGGATIASAYISRDDGLFHFDFVPDGDYTLRVSNARDVVWEPAQNGTYFGRDKERVIAKYGGTDQSLLLRSDTFGFNVTVPPKPVQ